MMIVQQIIMQIKKATIMSKNTLLAFSVFTLCCCQGLTYAETLDIGNDTYAISPSLYCVSPSGEMHGGGSLNQKIDTHGDLTIADSELTAPPYNCQKDDNIVVSQTYDNGETMYTCTGISYNPNLYVFNAYEVQGDLSCIKEY